MPIRAGDRQRGTERAPQFLVDEVGGVAEEVELVVGVERYFGADRDERFLATKQRRIGWIDVAKQRPRELRRLRPRDGGVLNQFVARINGSDPFVVRFGGFRTKTDLRALRDDPIPPHETVVIEARTQGVLTEPGWFKDVRLNQPGRFELQPIVGEFAGDVLQAPEEGIRSTPAFLQVNEPTGIDLKIWKEMLAVGNGEWEPRRIFSPGTRSPGSFP